MSKSKRIEKKEVMYHLGQMGFIAALIAILMVVVTVAKAQGL
jgi:hypothetical protein